MAEVFRTTRLVEFHDTDMAGIMHFASFFHYMESVEHEFIRSLGLSVHSLVEGDSLSFPRVSASCDFHAPARCEENLDAELQITRIGTKSVTYLTRFFSNSKLIASGKITCACCRIDPGKPLESVPIPESILEKLRPYLA